MYTRGMQCQYMCQYMCVMHGDILAEQGHAVQPGAATKHTVPNDCGGLRASLWCVGHDAPQATCAHMVGDMPHMVTRTKSRSPCRK